jgi:hypothetical protein
MNERRLGRGDRSRAPKGSSVLWILGALVLLSAATVFFIQWSVRDRGSTSIPADALSKIEQEKAKAQSEFQDFIKTPAGKIWEKHPYWDRDVCRRVAEGELFPGMSKEQAAEALANGAKIKRKRRIGTEEEWVAESQGEIILRFEDNVLRTIARK